MSKTTTSSLHWLPSAADGVAVTPSGTAWANSSWVELTASAPTDVFLAFLTFTANGGATLAAQVSTEFDIGVGAAASEVVVATHRVRVMPDFWGPVSTTPLGVLYASIASGSRVAVRLRHSATANTNIYRVAIGYYAALGGASGWASASPTYLPTGATTIQVQGSGTVAWAFGAWVEVIPAAAVTTNILITGIVTASIDTVNELQIGVGAVGVEAAIATLPYATSTGGGGGDGLNYHRFPRPFCVNSGSRVSLRTRFAATLRSANAFFGTLLFVNNR